MKASDIKGFLEEKRTINYSQNDLGAGWMDGWNFHRETVGKKMLCLDEDEIGFRMYKAWNNFDDYTARQHWTAKHIQTESKRKCAKLAKALSQTPIIICKESD